MDSDADVSTGVTDEQRVAAFRDRYGKVAYRAAWVCLSNGDDAGWEAGWAALGPKSRERYGLMAEAVIDAFVTGVPADGDGGQVPHEGSSA